MKQRSWLFLAPIVLMGSCTSPSQPSPAETSEQALNWEAIAKKIVERLDPEPREGILIAVKGDRFAALVPPLEAAIYQSGAEALGTNDVDGPQLSDDEYRELLRRVDALVILPGPQPSDKLYATMQDILRGGRGRTIHFHWEGAMPVPGGSLPPQGTIDASYQKALLETDYAALTRVQNEFEEALRISEIHVTTPEGTDLRFRIGDRQVTRQNGDASASATNQGKVLIDREIELPAGAIRVAPVEESVQGTIVFPAANWGGSALGPVTLQIQNGRVTGISSDNDAAVISELDSNPAARSFREFALGFNPLLAIPKENPWIPYYGYGAGVVRLSLGDNSELGGKVSGGYVRWNFFIDATVTVGDQVWVQDGQLEAEGS